MKRIGLDIHGVIDHAPEFFSELSHSLVNAGNEVHIITGASKTEEIVNKLAEFNIAYTHFFSIVDNNSDKVKYDAMGDPWMDDLTWDMAKGKYCEENKIHVHVDDTPCYGKYFYSTRYVLYEKSTMNMDMKVRAIVTSAPTDCDNYPCKKNCPQYIMYKDQVARAIRRSELYSLASRDSSYVDEAAEELLESIFECMV